VFAFTAAALILAGPERETVFHLGIVGCLAIVVFVWLENLSVIAAAKIAAFVLGVSAPASDLFEGYCYASVSFPIFIVATEVLLFVPDQQFTPWVLMACVGQLIFLGMASVTMISFVPMHGRYAWRTIVATFLTMLVASYCVVVALSYSANDEYTVHPLDPFAKLQSRLLSQRTFGVTDCGTVVITGWVTPNGNDTAVWFEWGDTPNLNNVTITRHFTKASDLEQELAGLKADTIYYYRLVGSSDSGSFKGQIHSFRTAHCPS